MNWYWIFFGFLTLIIVKSRCQEEQLPIVVGTPLIIQQYPRGYCTNYGYYLIDLNGRVDITSVGGKTLFKNSTHLLHYASEEVPLPSQNFQHNLVFYNSSGSFILTNVAQSNCQDLPSPLDLNIKYIPQTFDDIGINVYLYKPGFAKDFFTNEIRFSTKSGPFKTFNNGNGRGHFGITLNYDSLYNSSTTDQTFDFISPSGKETQVTAPSFLDQFYPAGNVDSVSFYPSCGINKKKEEPNIVLIETTGNPIYGSVLYFSSIVGNDTRPFYAVSKLDGKSQYISVHKNDKSFGESLDINVGVFNKENPITRQCTWEPRASSQASSTSTNSSYFVINEEKGVSMLNFVINGAVNLAPYEDLLWIPRNSTYLGEFIGYGTEQNYTYTRSLYVMFQGTQTNPQTIVSRFLFPTIELPTMFVDKDPPQLKNWEYEYLSSGWVLLRAHVTDSGSGLNQLIFGVNGALMTHRNLISGTIYDGVYEIRSQTFIISAGSPIIVLTDRVESQVPSLPIDDIELADITTFRFEPNNINVTTFGSLCTLYLDYNGARPEYPPAINIRLTKTNDILTIENFDEVPLMQWDSTLGLYKYQFFVPPRLFTGNIDYVIFMGQYFV
ncbi:hypothetical protein CYY_010451, partial [Polysphondylium violaceum]